MSRKSIALLITCAALVGLPGRVRAQSERDNVVLRWNEALLQVVQITRTPPAIAARAIAILNTCMFDAWVPYDDAASGTRLGKSLRVGVKHRTESNREESISYAAYRALNDLFPNQRPGILDPTMAALGYDPAETTQDTGTAAGIGNIACQADLDFRQHDGSNQLADLHPGPYSDYTSYASVNRIGILRDRNRWQPLIVNGVQQVWQLPHWGLVTPFALISGSQFRNVLATYGPLEYPSSAYWKQTMDLIDLNAQLGDREKVIAEYWADGAGTATPPGHWVQIAEFVSRRDRHSADQDVKMFFILGNALLDASIASWDIKRATDSIRPVTVVRSVMSEREIRAWGGPGLGTRVIDCKNFRPYLPTPPFSSYVSGHSTFSAAAAEILKRFTGSDAYGESVEIAAGSSLIERGLTPATSMILSWSTFTEAADQAGMSRRYGGIHFEADDIEGRLLGRLVANEVWAKASIFIEGNAEIR
ncbi:MAG TPA: vanadium-dependent haloperoxidase [Terriglobales bacterium]|nr:vanadium-dependent haloperoxidase [Terriglobales bacterium]